MPHSTVVTSDQDRQVGPRSAVRLLEQCRSAATPRRRARTISTLSRMASGFVFDPVIAMVPSGPQFIRPSIYEASSVRVPVDRREADRSYLMV